MSRSARACGLVLALALGGCGSLHGYHPEIAERPLPPALQARGDSPGARVDLARLPPAPGVRTVSLSQVIHRAQEESFAVLEAAARIETASGRVQTAMAGMLPGAALEVGGNYLYGRDINNAGTVLDDLDYATYEPSIRLDYRVNPGAVLARVAGLRRSADALALATEEARRAAALQAAFGYLELTLAHASQEIAAQLVADSERFVRITEARAQAEVGTGADVTRAQADAARARHGLIRARGTWEQASVGLAVLLRWPPEQRLVPAGRVIHPDALIDAGAAAELNAEALRARPDLRASSARAEAAEDLASAAWWELFGPELAAGIRERLVGTELGDLGPTTLAHVFVSMTVSFAELGQLHTAEAQAHSARIREAALREQIRGEVEAARAKLAATLAGIPEAKAAVDASERSYQTQMARFEAGTGLGIELIEAQNGRARARRDLAAAILRYNGAQMELAAALGHLSPGLVEEPNAGDAGISTQGPTNDPGTTPTTPNR